MVIDDSNYVTRKQIYADSQLSLVQVRTPSRLNSELEASMLKCKVQ